MNMGPVRDRSHSPGEPEKMTQEDFSATSRRGADNRELSATETRRRLAELADQKLRDCPDSDTSPALHDRRLNEVKARIASGYYSRPETQKAIAEKLFDSLDL